ncbi:hypothetical protein [Neptunomonas japonica]|uniref:Uncharacterized protein n=1 Tax=Neptunomonas japonica JAMM 1380 TaxID=1441457 RepID=A0A7R6SXF8_9GAMM|nr:hypothetical protein [Neptunomonas japonica]BBB30765.1 hypothetical protein NEJAP_2825 [Neptunomonas japonica JAMM 1380]
MKTLLNAALITSALFTSQAFAGVLNDFSTQSVEHNLAADVTTQAQGFTAVISPLSSLGASTEAHFATGSQTTNVVSSAVASFGLEAPANSTEVLL